jgi:hypothetical protein
MKTLLLMSIAVLVVTGAHAENAYKCHGDAACQAKRDGVSVEEAKRRAKYLSAKGCSNAYSPGAKVPAHCKGA